MVNAPAGEVVSLALCRVKDMPYNVSEYGHPAPNTYCSEQTPTVASFGALQDWDGITLFTYALNLPLVSDRITGHFEHKSHPTKLVTMPFGALAFRRGDIAPAKTEVSIGITLDDVKQSTRRNVKREVLAAEKGATWLDAFTHKLSLTLGSEAVPGIQPPGRTLAESDTGELKCDLTTKDAGVLVVNSARSKAVIGYGAEKSFDLGDLLLKPGPTLQKGFSVITASVVSGEGFGTRGSKILVTATGYAENTEMGWNADMTSVGDQWGKGPVLCEGIPFELILKARRIKAWALDPRGQRACEVTPTPTREGLALQLGPAYKTLWYEIAIE